MSFKAADDATVKLQIEKISFGPPKTKLKKQLLESDSSASSLEDFQYSTSACVSSPFSHRVNFMSQNKTLKQKRVLTSALVSQRIKSAIQKRTQLQREVQTKFALK